MGLLRLLGYIIYGRPSILGMVIDQEQRFFINWLHELQLCLMTVEKWVAYYSCHVVTTFLVATPRFELYRVLSLSVVKLLIAVVCCPL